MFRFREILCSFAEKLEDLLFDPLFDIFELETFLFMGILDSIKLPVFPLLSEHVFMNLSSETSSLMNGGISLTNFLLLFDFRRENRNIVDFIFIFFIRVAKIWIFLDFKNIIEIWIVNRGLSVPIFLWNKEFWIFHYAWFDILTFDNVIYLISCSLSDSFYLIYFKLLWPWFKKLSDTNYQHYNPYLIIHLLIN